MNARNIEIRVNGLHRRLDNEPMHLVYYFHSLILSAYNNTPETNETERGVLSEQLEAYNMYIACRSNIPDNTINTISNNFPLSK